METEHSDSRFVIPEPVSYRGVGDPWTTPRIPREYLAPFPIPGPGAFAGPLLMMMVGSGEVSITLSRLALGIAVFCDLFDFLPYQSLLAVLD